ncbi:hypothetical protein BDZ85DRAFT_115892 [Elsinoe ampelina]|uniref:Secreted protein n=1 Tax=Elsinoe ampelina TaxID=302913 RepID=A0A6A6GE22_9PEZI|nr:hypothetical protein BDZ85DRAFT_115892 [Elsinoe ampelina]
MWMYRFLGLLEMMAAHRIVGLSVICLHSTCACHANCSSSGASKHMFLRTIWPYEERGQTFSPIRKMTIASTLQNHIMVSDS